MMQILVCEMLLIKCLLSIDHCDETWLSDQIHSFMCPIHIITLITGRFKTLAGENIEEIFREKNYLSHGLSLIQPERGFDTQCSGV